MLNLSRFSHIPNYAALIVDINRAKVWSARTNSLDEKMMFLTPYWIHCKLWLFTVTNIKLQISAKNAFNYTNK